MYKNFVIKDCTSLFCNIFILLLSLKFIIIFLIFVKILIVTRKMKKNNSFSIEKIRKILHVLLITYIIMIPILIYFLNVLYFEYNFSNIFYSKIAIFYEVSETLSCILIMITQISIYKLLIFVNRKKYILPWYLYISILLFIYEILFYFIAHFTNSIAEQGIINLAIYNFIVIRMLVIYGFSLLYEELNNNDLLPNNYIRNNVYKNNLVYNKNSLLSQSKSQDFASNN